MALQLKPESVSIDKTGAIFYIKDATGVYSATNTGGYGFPNPEVGDIDRIIFTVSNFNSSDILSQTYVRVADPLHPEWLTQPTINQITSGVTVELSSVTLTGSPFPLLFSDGVEDLNMYTVMNAVKSGIVAQIGNPYVEGSNLDTFLIYDSIYLGNKLYDIDKTKTTSGGTVLFLIQELQDNGTQFQPAYRGNVKFINDKNLIEKLYGAAADISKSCDCKDIDNIMMMNLHRELAEISFEGEDYDSATTLLGKYNCC